jgi:drug/metabolite transporter (DMT)-like permease
MSSGRNPTLHDRCQPCWVTPLKRGQPNLHAQELGARIRSCMAAAHSYSTRATLAGLGAIALWSVLAALTVAAGKLPPFQLTAMAFAVGTLVGLVYARVTGQSLSVLRDVPWAAWALGLFGLLGYHVVYFVALARAPALEASLICYLWPLLIVVFAGFLPARLGGKPLTARHVMGASIAFAGSALVLAQGQARPDFAPGVSGGAAVGYLLALLAAFIWSSYSVASRLFQAVPSVAVIGFCAGTAVGAALLHVLFESWVMPQSTTQWLAIAGLGVGPLGLAFYIWDEGMKHGDIARLGLASYATPLLSTLVLAALGLGTLSPMLALAAVMVTVGAVVAGRG